MQYLVVTYWMWFVVALLVGGAAGYWLRWRLGQGGLSRVQGWGTAAFLIGLAVVVLHWLPQRAGLDLDTILLLSFGFALGGLLGGWRRAARSRKELASAALVSEAKLQSAVLGDR